MNVLILGGGLMGPAAAYNAMRDPGVERVTIADIDPHKLRLCSEGFREVEGCAKLDTVVLDLSDQVASVSLIREFDVVLAALPWQASMFAFRAALAAGVPIVDLAIPDDDQVKVLRIEAETAGGTILLGCGLEPGLTEIIARRLAAQLDHVDSLRIHCGGVPAVPTGPLGYKIVFGGTQLPLRDIPALAVEGGAPRMVQRYSDAERVEFEGVGVLESWHEGMMPWLLDLPEFEKIDDGAQKTIRWPGYAAKATVLLELGLLGREPVNVGGCAVTPKTMVDTVLYPHVKLGEGEEDITLFRVEVGGTKNGERQLWRTDMVDRRDPVLGFTSMARTTAFTGAIAARMIARGQIGGAGVFTAEELIIGEHVDALLEELAEEGIHFTTRCLEG